MLTIHQYKNRKFYLATGHETLPGGIYINLTQIKGIIKNNYPFRVIKVLKTNRHQLNHSDEREDITEKVSVSVIMKELKEKLLNKELRSKVVEAMGGL